MRLLEFPCGRPTAEPEEPTAEAAGCNIPEKRSRRASASPWRSSLLAISEDGTSVAAPSPAAVVRGGGSGKAKVKAKPKPKPKPASRVVSRSAKDDYQHHGVVPAFAPTAFLF